MNGTACSSECSHHQLCAVFRRAHDELVAIVTSVAYERYGLLVNGDQRVDPLDLHRWSDVLVTSSRRYLCHKDPAAYDQMLEVAAEVRDQGVTVDEALAAMTASFIFLTVYCVVEIARGPADHLCAEAVEDLSALAARLVADLIRVHGFVSRSA